MQRVTLGKHNAVVVTGASSGIGQASTLRLARQGWLVCATVRRAEDQEQLARLAGAAGVGDAIIPLLCDITDSRLVAALVPQVAQLLAERGCRLAGVVNNAGIAVAGPVEELPLARLRASLETNVIGAIAITQAFLPLLRRDHGRIIFVSSVSGRVALPYLGPYAASKFALEALADALRLELRPWSLPVSLIEPAAVATPIWAKGESAALADQLSMQQQSRYAAAIPRLQSRVQQAIAQSVPIETVTQAIWHALSARHPQRRYLLTRRPLLFTIGTRYLPDWLRDWILARAV